MDRSFFIEFFIVKHSSFFIGKAPPVASPGNRRAALRYGT